MRSRVVAMKIFFCFLLEKFRKCLTGFGVILASLRSLRLKGTGGGEVLLWGMCRFFWRRVKGLKIFLAWCFVLGI